MSSAHEVQLIVMKGLRSNAESVDACLGPSIGRCGSDRFRVGLEGDFAGINRKTFP